MVSPILIFFHPMTLKEARGFALLVLMLKEEEMYTSLSGSNEGSLCFTKSDSTSKMGNVMALTTMARSRLTWRPLLDSDEQDQTGENYQWVKNEVIND